MCWDKYVLVLQAILFKTNGLVYDRCITGVPGTTLSRNEENCLTNCVNRFIDTGIYLVNEIQNKRDTQ